MLGKQHLFFGIATASALTISHIGGDYTGLQSPAILIAGTAIGSLAPDIDVPTSIMGKMVLPVSFIINKIFGHRTITHDPIIWIPLSVFLTIKYPVLFGFFFGYLGHLFLDSFTAGGIPVCFLLNKKPFHLLPYRMKFNSNSNMARLMTIILSFVIILVIKMLSDIIPIC